MSTFRRSAHDRLASTPTGSSLHHRQGGAHQRNTVSFSSSATDLLRMRRNRGSGGGLNSPLSRSATTVNLGDQFGSSVELASTASAINSSSQRLRPSQTTTSATTLGPSPPRRTQSSPAVPTVARRTPNITTRTTTTTTTQARYERAADRREINRLGSNLDRVQGTMERRLMQHVDEANSSSELLGRAQRLTDRLAVLKRKLEMCFDLNDQIGNRRPGASLDRESAMSQVMAARAMLGNTNSNYNPLDDDQYDLSGATRSLRHLTDTQRQQLESLVRSEPTVLGIGGGMGGGVSHRGGGGVDSDGWQSYDPSAFINDEEDTNHNNSHHNAAAASSSSSYIRHGGGGDSIVLSPHMILQQLMADVETDDAPPDFICPITQCVMIDPVSTSDGNIYERAAITQWFLSFQHRNKIPTSPLTNLELSDFTLVPHDALRKAISAYLHGLMGGGGSQSLVMMGNHSGDGTTDWRNPNPTTATDPSSHLTPSTTPTTSTSMLINNTTSTTPNHGPLSEEPSRRFLSLLQSADTANNNGNEDASDIDEDDVEDDVATRTVPATQATSVVPPHRTAPSPPPNNTNRGVGAPPPNVPRGGAGVLLRGGPSSTTTPTPPNPSSLSSSLTPAIGGGGDSRPIWSSAVVPVDEPNSRFLNRLRMCEEADDDTLDMLALEGTGGTAVGGGSGVSSSHTQQHVTVRRPPMRAPVPSSTRGMGSRGGVVVDERGGLYEHRRLVPTNVFSSPSMTMPTANSTSASSSSTRGRVPTPTATTSRFGFSGALRTGPSLHHHPRGSSSPANLNTRRKF